MNKLNTHRKDLQRRSILLLSKTNIKESDISVA
jgi:hypothetical protein